MVRSILRLPAMAVIVSCPCAQASGLIERHGPEAPLTAPTAAGGFPGPGLAVVDVTGIPSMDTLGSANNVVMFLWVGPFNSVTGLGWDVVLQTIAPLSTRAEIAMLISNTSGNLASAVVASPGSADFSPSGPTQYSTGGQILDFGDYGLADIVALADGMIRLEFFDDLEHAPGSADGLWVSGTVQFQTDREIPPIPAANVCSLFALAGAKMLRRARRR